MEEKAFPKTLATLVLVAIVICHLTEIAAEVDSEKKEKCKILLQVKAIEKWLTKVNEEEIYYMKPHPEPETPKEDISIANQQPVDVYVNDDNSANSTIPVDYSHYEDLPDLEDFNFEDEDPYYEWYIGVTHKAARLLKKYSNILSIHNKTALRLLELYSIAGALYQSEPIKRKELEKAEEDMLENFLDAIKTGSRTCPQRPTLYKLDLKSRDCSVLKCIWESWQDDVGLAVREDFQKMVELSNRAAEENGYKDVGEVWRIDDVEDKNSEKEMKRLLDGIMPLYEQLHAYVRRKIIEYYFKNSSTSCGYEPGPDDPIPAHLTGNLIGQEWTELEDLVLPYPSAILPNFTKIMNLLHLNQTDMAHETEKFFTSLGFRPMTEKFWQKSTFSATEDNKFGCHARATDGLDGSDYRIFMCADMTLKDFGILHHEMGHIVAFMESENLPYKFRHGVNEIFGEGLGDSMALSVSTPDHLEKIFNLPGCHWTDKKANGEMTLSEKRDINALMRSALYVLPLIPYSFVLDTWRYKVFSGNITPEEYNRSWWKMRARYQGIAPPSKRPKYYFDPGAIIHVSYNLPYARYFFSLFVEFQAHKALCKLSNHNGPLHHCDIYQSPKAGKKLREILKQGGSKSTLELLKELTGDEGYKYEPIIEYYKPLFDWLKIQNEGQSVKWNRNFYKERFG